MSGLAIGCAGLIFLISGCNQLHQEQDASVYSQQKMTKSPEIIALSPTTETSIETRTSSRTESSGETDPSTTDPSTSDVLKITEPMAESAKPKDVTPKNKKKSPQINWQANLQLMGKQLIKTTDLPSSTIKVVVDDIKNDTGTKIDTRQLLQILSRQLRSSSRFSVIDNNLVTQARRTLELERQDSLKTRTKSIAVARHLKAPFILFTSVTGSNESPEITMQLMQVSSGELLWSQTKKITQENDEQ